MYHAASLTRPGSPYGAAAAAAAANAAAAATRYRD